jgi:hypothetical protein
VNSAPARGPDHFPFQGFRDSGIGSQGVASSLEFMCKVKVGAACTACTDCWRCLDRLGSQKGCFREFS